MDVMNPLYEYRDSLIKYPHIVEIERVTGLPEILQLPAGVAIEAYKEGDDVKYRAYNNNMEFLDPTASLAECIAKVQDYYSMPGRFPQSKAVLWPDMDQLKNHVNGMTEKLNFLIGNLYESLPEMSGRSTTEQVEFALVISSVHDAAYLAALYDIQQQHDRAIFDALGSFYNVDRPEPDDYFAVAQILRNDGIVYLTDEGKLVNGNNSYGLLDDKCLNACEMFMKSPGDIPIPKDFVQKLYEQFPSNMSIGYVSGLDQLSLYGETPSSSPNTYYVLDLSKGVIQRDLPTYEAAMQVAKENSPKIVPWKSPNLPRSLDKAERPYTQKEQQSMKSKFNTINHLDR